MRQLCMLKVLFNLFLGDALIVCWETIFLEIYE